MKRNTILIVDDEPSVRRLVERLLKRAGHHVLVAEDAAEARALVRHEEVHLILCDYVMPGENGLELLRSMKRTHPGIIRVLLTGRGDMSTAIEAINGAQVQYYLTKPFELSELLDTVNELLSWSTTRSRGKTRPFTAQRMEVISDLRCAHPGIDCVQRDDDGAIVIDDLEELYDQDMSELLAERPVTAPSPSEDETLLADDDFHKLIEG